MLAPWLGSLRNLRRHPEDIPGPYSLGSTAWADDYEEVRAVGSNNSTVRTRTGSDGVVPQHHPLRATSATR